MAAVPQINMLDSAGVFGKLPSALRTKIFLLVVQDKVHTIIPYPIMPLSQTCRLLRGEVIPILFREGTFYIELIRKIGSIGYEKQKEIFRSICWYHSEVPSPRLYNVQIACGPSRYDTTTIITVQNEQVDVSCEHGADCDGFCRAVEEGIWQPLVEILSAGGGVSLRTLLRRLHKIPADEVEWYGDVEEAVRRYRS